MADGAGRRHRFPADLPVARRRAAAHARLRRGARHPRGSGRASGRPTSASPSRWRCCTRRSARDARRCARSSAISRSSRTTSKRTSRRRSGSTPCNVGGRSSHSRAEDLKRARAYADAYAKAKGPQIAARQTVDGLSRTRSGRRRRLVLLVVGLMLPVEFLRCRSCARRGAGAFLAGCLPLARRPRSADRVGRRRRGSSDAAPRARLPRLGASEELRGRSSGIGCHLAALRPRSARSSPDRLRSGPAFDRLRRPSTSSVSRRRCRAAASPAPWNTRSPPRRSRSIRTNPSRWHARSRSISPPKP